MRDQNEGDAAAAAGGPQIQPGAAPGPPQPQHVTQHHHGSRGRRLLRRSGSLCGHRRRSLSTPAPLRAACSLALPPSTACSSPWEGSPSTMQLPPPSTQHPMVWCQSARGNGSQQACRQPGIAAALRPTGACSMTRDSNEPPDWPSEAPLALRMASPGALFAFLGAGQRPAHRLCSSEQHVSRMLSSSLPALACEFELAGLAPGPRLISAILEYAILAGSLLSRT